ncbi:cytochrome c peroxidase [Filimonas lacunae]|uniref:Cytochrome c peroxidase n=1 Tax=Filimonas lacunae TaxID=477680 RepID=A0A173MKI6_9BACT|nr:cytochrome c peroxidase [Filimonas lacunae]BAV08114.1 cytochrome-c peroxidase [Filimonas lacunae]SIT09548.1 cytochrome c peroxidase [Filimonas lacunae]
MKTGIVISAIVLGVCLCTAFVARYGPHPHITRVNFPQPAGWPQPHYNFKANPLSQEGIALGRRLFYDGRLSKDGNFPCASCHQQFAAFTNYDHNLSHGFNNTLTTRNAPGLFNLAWQQEFMQDGGINHLDLQPLAPLTAPNEMAEDIDSVLMKLRADKPYRRMFKAAFGDTAINTQRMTKALSQFMLMMVSADSKYDQVMQGKAQFNLPERLGYGIFQQKCITCHPPPLFTDFSYRNIGMEDDPYNHDMGRMKITGKREDSLKFRVPSLRNVMVTAPYGHDGRFFSLIEIFEHYRKRVKQMPNTDSLLRKGIPLSNFEIGQLTAFLYTLTDSTFITDKRFDVPDNMLVSQAADAADHPLPAKKKL